MNTPGNIISTQAPSATQGENAGDKALLVQRSESFFIPIIKRPEGAVVPKKGAGIISSQFSRITFFVPCLVDTLFPDVAQAVVTVFEGLGFQVDCPQEQTCCGQMALNSGYRSKARELAKRFITLFEQAEVIVCSSGSCVTMIRKHYPLLFQNEPNWLARAEGVAGKTYEFTQFLVDVLGVVDLGARHPGRATYHDSCHLNRALGVREQPRVLLGSIRGLKLVEMEDSLRCCGFGGMFALKYPGISSAIVQDKVDSILATGADMVVGCDMGCLMNIQGRLNRLGSSVRVFHLAQLLTAEK